MNEALLAEGIHALETDLAELIVQLDPDDKQSHILVPAIHRNRAEIRALFERTIAQGQSLGNEASAIAEAARLHLRNEVPDRADGRLGRELRDRRDGHDRRRRVRGQRAHVPDAAAACSSR